MSRSQNMPAEKKKIRDSFVKLPDKLQPAEIPEEIKWYMLRRRILRWIDLLIEIWKKYRANRSLPAKIEEWLRVFQKIVEPVLRIFLRR